MLPSYKSRKSLMKSWGKLHWFIVSALRGYEWLASHPQPLYTGEGDIAAHGMRSWVGPRDVLGALGEQFVVPAVASSPYPIHDTGQALPTPLVELLAKQMIFCLDLDLTYFLLCVSVQFYFYSPCCVQLQQNFVLTQVAWNSIYKRRMNK